MADALTRIKNRLKIDQTNLASGTVISTSNNTAKIRLRDGTQKTAYIPSGVSVSTGSLVQIGIDGNLATVQGGATLQELAGEKVVTI